MLASASLATDSKCERIRNAGIEIKVDWLIMRVLVNGTAQGCAAHANASHAGAAHVDELMCMGSLGDDEGAGAVVAAASVFPSCVCRCACLTAASQSDSS